MTRLLTGLALLLTVGLVACGGDTAENNDYVEAVNKAQTDFADGISKAQSAGASNPQKVFTDMGASIDKVVSDLKAVDPPDDVTTEHNTLISELERFGAAVDKAGESLTSNDPQKISDAQAEFAQEASGVSGKIGTTIQQINSKLQE